MFMMMVSPVKLNSNPLIHSNRFGDSVNVALEMESKSKPDRVLCSSAAAKLLKKQAPGIAITKRSNGNTFWINDGKAAFSL